MAPKQQMRVDRQARATAHNAKRKYHEIQASILPACEAYAEWESCSMGLGWRRTKGGLVHTTLFFLISLRRPWLLQPGSGWRTQLLCWRKSALEHGRGND